MSVDAITWARKVPVSDPARRPVRASRADYAKDKWSTFVGQERLSDECLVSKRTVHRILAEFEKRGLITREERRRPDGYRSSDRIQLHRDAGSQATPCHVSPEPTSGDSGADLRRQPEQPQVTPGVHAEPSVEPPVEPSVENTSSLGADEVTELCDQLAERVATQQSGRRPVITDRWRKDMRLLLERGPLHQDTPEALTAEKVATTIGYVFDHLSDPQGSSGFCWAAQIRSPAALRDHWHQMANAAQRLRQAQRGASASAIDRAVARGAGRPSLFDANAHVPAIPGASWAARAIGAGQ